MVAAASAPPTAPATMAHPTAPMPKVATVQREPIANPTANPAICALCSSTQFTVAWMALLAALAAFLTLHLTSRTPHFFGSGFGFGVTVGVVGAGAALQPMPL
ncbi:hypothetical protein [Phytohabitans rumicis]|uniref:hypothetical protein n=1 Tax=Phytohabitans rumicis TaxID=1076125 RepID=UPI0015665C91|nr:hypothetical protein [Phytohabitans rumicis]